MDSDKEVIDVPRNDLQMNSDLLEISLKKMDDMSTRLNMVTDFVEKQQQKDSDLPVTSVQQQKDSNLPVASVKEKKTKKKVVKHKCFYETRDYKIKNRQTLFVKGFDCSFPFKVIKRKLREHFSSCGEVARVYLPHHCEPVSPLGYAFINMRNDEKEALKLDGTRFDGMYLEVTMDYEKSEYNGFPNRRGCGRCLRNIMKRRAEDFYPPTIRIPGNSTSSIISDANGLEQTAESTATSLA